MFFRWNIWGLKETQSTAFVEVVFVERALIQLTERLNRSLLLGLKATERCQERMRRGLEGFSLCAPHKNLVTRSCFPTNLPLTGPWHTTNTLSVNAEGCLSRPFWIRSFAWKEHLFPHKNAPLQFV